MSDLLYLFHIHVIFCTRVRSFHSFLLDVMTESETKLLKYKALKTIYTNQNCHSFHLHLENIQYFVTVAFSLIYRVKQDRWGIFRDMTRFYLIDADFCQIE